MSWEVSSMLSKRSFFNRTLFRKNLTRFWPLWGGAALAGAMVPLYLLLALLGMPDANVSVRDFGYALYATDVYAVPAVTAGYAILCAMAVWGYLYNSRSVGLMHTLPVDRTGLFVTNTLSGLAMMLIPYAVVGAFSCLIALFWGFFDLAAVMNTVLAVAFMTLLFFGLATFCAMLTGHALVLPVFYLLANFLAHLMEMLVTGLAEDFLLGVWMTQDMGMLGFLSPVMQIYRSVRPVAERLPDGTLTGWRLQGLWVLGLYALAGLALLALAWYLYRRRHSESAGDVVAFRWLRPVFRYGTALLSGLTLGRLLYELLRMALFHYRDYALVIPVWVCMALAGVLGYYVASMLLEKSLRVFRGSLPGVAAVCVGAALVCGTVSMDVFGAERWVPDPSEVEMVYLGDYEVQFSADQTEPEKLQQIIDIHRAIVEDRNYIRDGRHDTYQSGKCVSRWINLHYTLRNGRTVSRGYNLWVTADRAADPSTYDGMLLTLYTQDSTAQDRVKIPDNGELRSVYIYNYNDNGEMASRPEVENLAVYDALLQDAAEGNVPGYDLLRESAGSYSQLGMELEYRSWKRDGYVHTYKQIEVYPTMTHTLEKLIELGYVTEAEISQWNQEMALEDSGPIPADTVVRSGAVQ